MVYKKLPHFVILPRWSSGLRRADIWLIQWTIIWRRGFDSRRRQVPRRKTGAFNLDP